MNIFFQTKNLDLYQEAKDAMAHRMKGLGRFFSGEAHAYLDIEKTTSSHHGDDLYYVSIRIEEPGNQYFTDEYRAGVKEAFDHAYDEIFRMVRSDRNRTRSLARRAAARMKRMFKRN